MPPAFQPTVTLATPASDLVIPTFQNFDAYFGRTGNDTIYPDAPVVNGTPGQNIDFLFGDAFDTTVQEYVALVLAGFNQGDPLAILDIGLPTAGADRFVLGDRNQPYYSNTGSPLNLISSTNFLGFNEFGVIFDFNPAQDTIQLNGKPSDYLLIDANGVQVPGVTRAFTGKALFSLQQGIPDLIGYIVERPELSLSLTGNYFRYVDQSPTDSPAQSEIRQIGTTGVDLSVGAATDPYGNLYITGFTSGSLQPTSQGDYDAWVAKFNSQGNQVFLNQFGTSGSDQALSIATDNRGNFYLSGSTTGNLFGTLQTPGGDVWVAKYDNNGVQLWARQFANPDPNGYANASFGVDVDPAGNVYVSGLTIKPNLNPDIFQNFPAQDDSFITKFDVNGNQQWFTEIGSFFFDENYDIAVDKDGNSYISGWTQGLVRESDPSRQTLKYDAYVAKVNTSGQLQWIQQLGSANQGTEFSWGVDTDSQGNVYATGWTSGLLGTTPDSQSFGSYDLWLAKLQPTDGTPVFIKQIGSPGDDATYLGDLQIDAQDNIYITGFTNGQLGEGPQDTSYNAVIAKFDTSGTTQWIQQFGSPGQLDYASGVTVDDTTGKLYATGFTDGLLGTTQGATGAVDAWVAQLDRNNGDLQSFSGSANNFISTDNPVATPTLNVSNLLTAENPPIGDNTINNTSGNEVINQLISSKLGSIFSPSSQDSFASVFAEGVKSGNAPFLSSSDLDFLQPTIG